ncbi:hypothetical protein QTO34_019781 [Cnephaeus nilssonii]|uniref:Uncharacterized protein n=1 Tax=Cnephaeus nilssonii TaxID=3371016 RepID=A0AA40LPC0_CNENI|nr:hypothetical protein QTO34_019781 [Eptesicus nilssonii]
MAALAAGARARSMAGVGHSAMVKQHSHLLPVPAPLAPAAGAQCWSRLLSAVSGCKRLLPLGLPLRVSPPPLLLRGNRGSSLWLTFADGAGPAGTCSWRWPQSLCVISVWEQQLQERSCRQTRTKAWQEGQRPAPVPTTASWPTVPFSYDLEEQEQMPERIFIPNEVMSMLGFKVFKDRISLAWGQYCKLEMEPFCDLAP